MISKSDLEYWYIHRELPTRIIAEKFGVSYGFVRKMLIRFNIPIRTVSESMRLKSYRERNPHCGFGKGNIFSLLSYKDGKNAYRKYTIEVISKPFCEICGITEPTAKRLVVHHLDRNEHNNDLDNLSILCDSCHKKEHGHLNRIFVQKTH